MTPPRAPPKSRARFRQQADARVGSLNRARAREPLLPACTRGEKRGVRLRDAEEFAKTGARVSSKLATAAAITPVAASRVSRLVPSFVRRLAGALQGVQTKP